ncbi:MAG: GNAT family N-acetyltransferase [Roseovarius sp.]|nr:GNAT family N-acetyltransferase [Roseovarius sp.]
MTHKISFVRLPTIAQQEISEHMSDPRLAQHLPLLTFEWDAAATRKFINAKEAYWLRDGLGHWAILADQTYIGWGGFQKEGDEWDYGLVLKPEAFGLGLQISKKAIHFARSHERIPFITFLLPPTRKNLGALSRLGARRVGDVEHEGEMFLKYRLETV